MSISFTARHYYTLTTNAPGWNAKISFDERSWTECVDRLFQLTLIDQLICDRAWGAPAKDYNQEPDRHEAAWDRFCNGYSVEFFVVIYTKPKWGAEIRRRDNQNKLDVNEIHIDVDVFWNAMLVAWNWWMVRQSQLCLSEVP